MQKLVVFISHINEEKEIAVGLKGLMQSAFLNMIDVFVSSDPTSIHLGRQSFEEITFSLSKCAVEIILASPESIKRPWINFEAGAGWSRKIPVIPLCHSGMVPSKLPPPLSFLQGATATAVKELEQIFPLLANAIGSAQPIVDFSEFIATVTKFEETTRQFKEISEESSIRPTDGLSQLEFETLAAVAEETDSPGAFTPVHSVRTALHDIYRSLGVVLAISILERKGLVTTSKDSDYNNNTYSTVAVSEDGWRWLEANMSRLNLHVAPKPQRPAPPRPPTKPAFGAEQQFKDDDIPLF